MNNTKSIYYPPGGILIWIIIYLELITFGMAILALAYYGSEERELFHNSSLKLNKTIGTINTILLLEETIERHETLKKRAKAIKY